MHPTLLLSVRFHDGRYHGEQEFGVSEWPPAPARLFQALVSGITNGAMLTEKYKEALKWLETLDAPTVAVPAGRNGQPFSNYVPGNDRDAVEGGSKKLGEIQSEKTVRSHIFDADIPLLFIWTFESGEHHAHIVCGIAERLYQLGRGIDMAWAWAELINQNDVETRLAEYNGVVHRPSKGHGGTVLLCPRKGSFLSLTKRYNWERFPLDYPSAEAKAPRPSFVPVVYDSPLEHRLFEIRTVTRDSSWAPLPLIRTAELITNIRDKAVQRLKDALPEKAPQIDRVFVGREATEADKASRVRIIPLPSIGHRHVDYAIRRALVEIPPNCPFPVKDIIWAFENIEEVDPATGEILWSLISAEESGMLTHYGAGDDKKCFRVWQTVTPAMLPRAKLPNRGKLKGHSRLENNVKLSGSVVNALRHSGITAKASRIIIQREPFEQRGAMANMFELPERFANRRAHHVEITFDRPIHGPVVIGDGRYVGLGIMAPLPETHGDIFVFTLPPEVHISVNDTSALLLALRRALMALDCAESGADKPSRLFSGHAPDGAPDREGRHAHIFLAADSENGTDNRISRLIVIAPWAADRNVNKLRRDAARLEKIVFTLKVLRAGSLGLIHLSPATALADGDPLIGPAREWQSQTKYVATRNMKKRDDSADIIKTDVMTECHRRGLPCPAEIEVLDVYVGPRGGRPTAKLRLRFANAVTGPFLIGRDSHEGGGLFHTVL